MNRSFNGNNRQFGTPNNVPAFYRVGNYSEPPKNNWNRHNNHQNNWSPYNRNDRRYGGGTPRHSKPFNNHFRKDDAPISAYFHPSMLEDPWKDLISKQQQQQEKESNTTDSDQANKSDSS